MKNVKPIILILGLLIMVGIGIYPPWVYQNSDGKSTPMGYAPIWAPPEVKIEKNANIFGFKLEMEMGTMKANALDIWRLLIQEAIAAGITFGAAMVAGNNGGGKTESES
ncbi:MAG: hypothetical protein R3C24_10520 [Cyanobacteriota/Melainabacteria group bacterium]